MTSISDKAEHKAGTITVPGLTQERVKSIILLVVQLYSTVQTGLTLAGVSQLPFTTDQVSTAITGVIALITGVWAWWRNNNVTSAAVVGEQLVKGVKNGVVNATQGTDPAPSTVAEVADSDTTDDVPEASDAEIDALAGQINTATADAEATESKAE